eukprot:3550061-Pyramimonas_sp.AAC.1
MRHGRFFEGARRAKRVWRGDASVWVPKVVVDVHGHHGAAQEDGRAFIPDSKEHMFDSIGPQR